MKNPRTSFLISLGLLSAVASSSADILYVNNDTAYPADYRTFDAAFAAATSGDTIMLAPSTTSYGDIVITGKAIKLVGNGTGVEHPLLQPARADLASTVTGPIYIGHDSHSVTSGVPAPDFSPSNGTKITGIRTTQGVHIWSDDCVFTRCKTDSSLVIYGDRNVISGSMIPGGLTTLAVNDPDIKPTGTLVSNCLVRNVSVSSYTSATFTHCVIHFSYPQMEPVPGSNSFYLAFATLKHCIIASSDKFGSITSDGVRLHHCLIVGDPNHGVPTHSAGNGNITTTDTTGVFEDGFALKAGSPAIGAGENGEDLGIFGGPTPFEWGGVPAIPLIEKLDILSANPETGLSFRVEAVARD